MTTWSDQVALVTGGARGIGRATALLLAKRGACVNYTAHIDAAKELVAEITAAGGRAIEVMADVAEATAIEAMVARTEKELGPLTILVNNAGMSWQGTLDTYDSEQVARMRRSMSRD
jgi:3-oxoacyl-[acyl-carrier protein] reductase